MTAQSISMPLDLPVQEATSSQTKARLGLLDGARLLAAAGIVWVHVTSTETGNNVFPRLYPLGTFGVPFYLFVAVLFMARGLTREPRKSLGSYFTSRLFRVYVPFLAWSLVYVGLAEIKLVMKDGHLHAQPWSVFYAGGHQHLWFLPYLIVVTMLGAALVRGLEFQKHLRYIVSGMLVAGGIALCFVNEPAWIAERTPYGDVEFWRFGFRALPTACWSIAFALLTAIHGSLPRTSIPLAIAGALLLIGSLIGMDQFEPTRALRGAAGFGLLLLALCPMRVGIIERFGSLGKYSYGVYLSHVVFVRIFVLWMQKFDIEPTPAFLVVEFAVVFGASLGLSVLFSKSRYTRWLLGD